MRLAGPQIIVIAFRDGGQPDLGAIHALRLAGKVDMTHAAVAFGEGYGLDRILGQDAGKDLVGRAVAISYADMSTIHGVAFGHELQPVDRAFEMLPAHIGEMVCRDID